MSTYKTRQREEILRLFKENPDVCYTARELIEQKAVDAGQATIYRTLAVLTAENKLRRFSSGQGAVCYRLACSEASVHHVHAVCKVCGEMLHANGAFLDIAAETLDNGYGFKLDTGSTVLYGTCRRCRSASAQNENTINTES